MDTMNMNNSNDTLLDTTQLADRAGVHRNTVRNWRKAGLIPYIQTSRKMIRYRWSDVERALSKYEVVAAA